MNKSKKGLSPIIATVLLITISLALAVIIFMWARGFIDESILKNGGDIESVCKDVRFLAEFLAEPDVSSGTLAVGNEAEIPIYGFEIKERTGGDVIVVNEETDGVDIGDTEEISVSYSGEAEELIVTPILLGEDSASRKKWVCDDEFAQTIGL